MRRVTGIGGIFFQAQDPDALRTWYKDHLGIDVQDWGGAAFPWTDAGGRPVSGTTAWNITAMGSEYFAPSTAPFMINYRVEDLRGLLALLREEGCNVIDKTDEGQSVTLQQLDEAQLPDGNVTIDELVAPPFELREDWMLDPEGNKIELWQPPVGE